MTSVVFRSRTLLSLFHVDRFKWLSFWACWLRRRLKLLIFMPRPALEPRASTRTLSLAHASLATTNALALPGSEAAKLACRRAHALRARSNQSRITLTRIALRLKMPSSSRRKPPDLCLAWSLTIPTPTLLDAAGLQSTLKVRMPRTCPLSLL